MHIADCRCAAPPASHKTTRCTLHQAAKVPEYLAVLLCEREIRRHILTNGVYQLLPPDADGSWRLRVESGLWLDGQALLAGDTPRVLAKMQEGIRATEHGAFVDKLARMKRPK